MMVATHSRHFFSLPFDGIPQHSASHPLPADFSGQPINRQSRMSRFFPLEATTFLRWFSLVFVTPDPILLTSYAVLRLRSSSVTFVIVTPLRQTEHYSPISLLFHLSPFPATGGPGNSNNSSGMGRVQGGSAEEAGGLCEILNASVCHSELSLELGHSGLKDKDLVFCCCRLRSTKGAGGFAGIFLKPVFG